MIRNKVFVVTLILQIGIRAGHQRIHELGRCVFYWKIKKVMEVWCVDRVRVQANIFVLLRIDNIWQ